jgi:Holliday junction resolvasome RuvABC endonuclease subunit
MSTPNWRILAIDPGTRYLGVAILEEAGLVYYAVRDLRCARPAGELTETTRELLGELILTYEPTILAYEKSFYVQSRTSALLQAQEAEIYRVGRESALGVVSYFPTRVREVLCGDQWATKDQVASLLAQRFKELERLRFPGKALQNRYWLHMFDAVAVAVVASEGVTAEGTGRAAGKNTRIA